MWMMAPKERVGELVYSHSNSRFRLRLSDRDAGMRIPRHAILKTSSATTQFNSSCYETKWGHYAKRAGTHLWMMAPKERVGVGGVSKSTTAMFKLTA